MPKILRPGAPLAAWQAWPDVNSQWPTYNIESPQAKGLVMWLPIGVSRPTDQAHIDRVQGLSFTEGGTPTWIADGTRGWSLLFDDASSEYLDVGIPAITSYPFTFTAWVYADAVVNQCILCVGDTAGNDNWHVVYLTSGNQIRAGSRDGLQGLATSTGTYAINTWHMITGVFHASNLRAVWIDGGGRGINVADISPAGLDTTSVGVLQRSGKTWYFSGRIADARIYDRALSNAAIYELYRNPWDLYQIPRRVWSVAAPAGNIIPVIMHHRQQQKVV
jgi:hypothetical protein